ncbi:amine oxidase [Dichotomocladium elegans]|nr:amine oxidase [Dichotomocladium elegans]
MRGLFAAAFAVIAFVNCADARTIRTKVAILGGGVAGISAARNLTANGITDFVIVDARHILGGRAQDVPFAGINVEIGCNWVQGLGTNPINELREKYNLKTVLNDGENVVFRDANGLVNATESMNAYSAAYDAIFNSASQRLASDQVDLSARAALSIADWYAEDALDKAVEYYNFDWEMGEGPEVSSLIYSMLNDNMTYSVAFGPDSDGDQFVIDPRGFKHIFLAEAATFLKEEDPRVLLNTLITKIEYDPNGVVVYTNTSDTILADYAISTFSVGVLKSRDIEWSPKLPPWKIEGIHGFDMATYQKIFLNFPSQFWDDNQYVVYVDPSRRGYFNAWQNLNAPGFVPNTKDTNIFFVTLTEDWAHMAESMTDKEIQDRAMEVLRTMYGNNIPEPTEILVPRWHSNPLFRGTYSNWPIGELEQHHINMKAPLLNRVFFAGEAMSREFYGFLQGSWFTGAEAAASIKQCSSKHGCPRAEYFPAITNTNIKPHYVT